MPRFGVYIHQLWLMWLGAGVIGGIGLGLGYISPVSTLIKWFPDRRGMATGMAIMGFGGGAMIGSPLATILMNGFGGGAYSLGGITLPWAGFRTATDPACGKRSSPSPPSTSFSCWSAPSDTGCRRPAGSPRAGRLPPTATA